MPPVAVLASLPAFAMLVSAVMVHYRAPELACRAAAALRSDCARAGFDCEVVVVDNGSEPEDRPLLEASSDRLVTPDGNLGYAGGLNRGIAEARGDRLLLANPDVMVLPGCAAALVAALEAGAAAAGPRFFWDEGRRLLLPPTEERSRRAALHQRLAPAAKATAALARRRWRRHARRHWLATEPFETVSLSGALLAVRRGAWERVGPFDEGFPLYFEETDWLLRLSRAGLTAVHVPGAEAVHLYDQSASSEPRSRSWFSESRHRFERRYYGSAFARVLRWVDRLDRGAGDRRSGTTGARARGVGLDDRPEIALALPSGSVAPLWVEVSPSAQGFPAASECLGPVADGAPWLPPREVWHRLRPGAYWVRVADARGAEGHSMELIKAAQPLPTGY